MSYKDYVNTPMQDNDAGAKTLGEYLGKLLSTLWEEGEGFSGKRPFGNSGWEYDIYTALVSAKCVDGKLDEDGYVEDVDYSKANSIVREVIRGIFDDLKAGD